MFVNFKVLLRINCLFNHLGDFFIFHLSLNNMSLEVVSVPITLANSESTVNEACTNRRLSGKTSADNNIIIVVIVRVGCYDGPRRLHCFQLWGTVPVEWGWFYFFQS